MTAQSDIQNSKFYKTILDHGFVGIVQESRPIELPDGNVLDLTVPAIMGSDSAIVQAARVSYGPGTKTVREDSGLIRYLLSHKHTSPFEMCEIKFHIKLPIFCMRQLVRHRTSSLNEISARYSILPEEMYLPDPSVLQPQSSDNKQGRAGEFQPETIEELLEIIDENNIKTYKVYESLNEKELARELSRITLPVSTYTELYWKQNLHNLMHLMKLRRDSHAQYEIRVIADAMFELVKPYFPIALQAWEDYSYNAINVSRMEKEFLQELIGSYILQNKDNLIEVEANKDYYIKKFGLSKREWSEIERRWFGTNN